jgi:uncharacterized phage-associated protein
MPSTLNKYQFDKLGNTLIYFATNVGDFGKTKALKLLFLLEEKSIKNLGIPFFGFDFKVWQFGPVVDEVYNDLNNRDLPLLSQYIKRIEANTDEFEAVAEFNDDEFSNNDIDLMKQIVAFARNKTATDLVKITHGKNSLWLKAAEENNLIEGFENKTITTTDINIDFLCLVKDDNYLKERYESSLEYLQFNNLLKA